MQVEIKEERYEIRFPYNPEYIEFCKALQGSRYNPAAKIWTALRNVPNAHDLHNAGHYSDDALLRFQPTTRPTETGHAWTLSAHLYKHQKEWMVWCATRSKALLTAEMGLGKTLMALQWMMLHRVTPKDVLVICPSSLIYNWVNEFKKFTGADAIAVTGTAQRRLSLLKQEGIHVVNYEFFTLNVAARESLGAKCVVVLDESHKIKNPSSERAKVLHRYTHTRTHILLLTGTPISQGAHDYYSQFRAIDSRLLGASFTAFKSRYCEQQQIPGAPFGVRKITGYKNLDELNKIIAPYSFTRLKKDCLDLPEKTYTKHYVELSAEQARFYKQLKTEMAAFVNGADDSPVLAQNILTRMLRLSQVTQGFVSIAPLDEPENTTLHEFKENPKLKALAEIIDDIPEYESIVIMCRFTHDVAAVMSMLEKEKIRCCRVDGQVPSMERFQCIEGFQEGKFRVLVGQIQVAGVGITLTRANKMIFFSNDYSLVNRLQAEDRIHRIGQIGESCTYIDIVAKDTIDEHVIKALQGKSEVASQLTDLRKHFSA